MAPILIASGVSQLFGILRDQFQSSGTTSAAAGSGSGQTGSVGADFRKLVTDLQAGSSASPNGASPAADPKTAVADDLQALASDASKVIGHHHHHHGGGLGGGLNQSGGSGTGTGAGGNQVQDLASSLLAYVSNQNRGTAAAGSGTSITA